LPVVIVPVVADGDTVDLAAISLVNQRISTRLGYGRGLGLDAIERARWGGCILHLVHRPLVWMQRQADAVQQSRRHLRAVAAVMSDPWRRGTVDETLPDDYAHLFDIGKVVALVDGVPPERIAIVRERFYEHVYRLFPPSTRDKLMCVP